MQLTIQPSSCKKTSTAYTKCDIQLELPKFNKVSFKGANDTFNRQEHFLENLNRMGAIKSHLPGAKKKAEIETSLQEIDFRTKQCEEREIEQGRKERRLENKEDSLNSKKVSLEATEGRLEKREELLDTREKGLDTREKGLDGREKTLSRKEAAVVARENQLDIREQDLNSREEAATRRKQEGNQLRKEGIQMKEDAIRLKEESIDERRKAIKIKKDALDISESKILNRFSSQREEREKIQTLKEEADFYSEQIAKLKIETEKMKDSLEKRMLIQKFEQLEEQLLKKFGKGTPITVRNALDDLCKEVSIAKLTNLSDLIIELSKRIK